MLLCFTSEFDCRVGHHGVVLSSPDVKQSLTVGLDTCVALFYSLSLTVKQMDTWCCFCFTSEFDCKVGTLGVVLF